LLHCALEHRPGSAEAAQELGLAGSGQFGEPGRGADGVAEFLQEAARVGDEGFCVYAQLRQEPGRFSGMAPRFLVWMARPTVSTSSR